MISVKTSQAWSSRPKVISRVSRQKISLLRTISRRQLSRFLFWCYSSTAALQPFITSKCVVMIKPLQSVDFVKKFQSVIIFWLPLVSTALVLLLCVWRLLHLVVWLIIMMLYCIFGKLYFWKFLTSET